MVKVVSVGCFGCLCLVNFFLDGSVIVFLCSFGSMQFKVGVFFFFMYVQYVVVWGFYLIVWYNYIVYIVLMSFNGIYCRMFFIQQVRSDWYRNNGVNFLGVFFQCFFFDQMQNRE